MFSLKYESKLLIQFIVILQIVILLLHYTEFDYQCYCLQSNVICYTYILCIFQKSIQNLLFMIMLSIIY